MAGQLTFLLNKNSAGDSYVTASYYCKDGRMRKGIGIKADPKLFPDKLPKQDKSLLARLTTLVNNYEVDCRLQVRQTKKAEVSAIIEKAIGRTPEKVAANRLSLQQMFDDYRAGAERTVNPILHKGKRYSDSWLRMARSISGVLLKLPISSIPADDVTEEDMRRWVSALTSDDYAMNSVTTYTAILLGAYNGARKMKWHAGKELDGEAFMTDWEDVDHGVYLTESEQDKILALPLDGDKARYRDAFILGCSLGLRYSDLARLTPDHREGDRVDINTKKTKTKVMVPLNARARMIWDRYGGSFHLPDRSTMMRHAQKFAKDAGIKGTVLFSRTEGGEIKEKRLKRWEMIGTHTMRRSFATNAVKSGVPQQLVMKVTGHKTASAFQRYIRLSDDEHAEQLQKHAFFN